jgi:DnaD/phage-associated family protein
MGDLFLDKGKLLTTTAVSNYFIDAYMPHANGEFVKVYLYLLRLASDSGSDLSLEAIADKFACTESDVSRALHYWADLGLLTLTEDTNGSIHGIRLEHCLPKTSTPTVMVTPQLQAPVTSFTQAAPAAADTAEEADIPSKPAYTSAQLAAFSEIEDVQSIIFTAEQYLGRTLSPNDNQTLIYLYDVLDFSYELIDYLIEYCVSNGKKRMRYIEKTALNWYEEGIVTLEQAKAQTSLYSNKYYPVMRALGISDHTPTEVERKQINQWLEQFPMELVIEACNRTMASLHKPSFPYVSKILSSWSKNQVNNLKDVTQLDEAHKQAATQEKVISGNGFNNFAQHDYDYDLLEKQLLTSRR